MSLLQTIVLIMQKRLIPTATVVSGQPLPDRSALYPDTIHAVLFPKDPNASHDIAETTSPAS
ncbi:MAG: hypothetical protein ABJB85_06820 [Nitrososphaerota archaeon]